MEERIIGKVGQWQGGLIDSEGNPIESTYDPYYDDIIEFECENDGCIMKVEMTQYERDSHFTSSYCGDCIKRYGIEYMGEEQTVTTLDIKNETDAIRKCKLLKHDISILSKEGCFECSMSNLKYLTPNQEKNNEIRIKKGSFGTPTEVNGIVFRSKKESEVYNQLIKVDDNTIYEQLAVNTFKGEKPWYLPDFYLPKLNLFVEYRGYDAVDAESKLQWEKSFNFIKRIKKGIRRPENWNNYELPNVEYCNYLFISQRVAKFCTFNNIKFESLINCPSCKQPSIFLDFLGSSCIFCGQKHK